MTGGRFGAGGVNTDLDVEELAATLKPLAYGKRLTLLQYLTRPHYLEEIASHLGMARQAAQKHVDQLLTIGVIEKQQGRRDSGPVVEYVVVPQALFALTEEVSRLGVLRPVTDDSPVLERTMLAEGLDRADVPPGGPQLTVVHGRTQGEVHRLGPGTGPWAIGRDTELPVCLEYDPFISNRHAEIVRDGARIVLVDTYSTNGTFLNWQRLERGGEAVLSCGDVVGVGKSLLVYRD